MLVAHNHASQQHTTNNNNTPEGRPAVMEGGANVGGVNNDVGEGGSPVVTDPSQRVVLVLLQPQLVVVVRMTVPC